jgi:hypothetical protein
MKTKTVILLAGGCFFLAVGVVMIYMWQNRFSISETGTIGDGFNGLLAPFISFGGAVLVFLSFREQIRANLLLSSQWQFDLLLKTFNEVQETYGKITVAAKPGQRRISETGVFSGEQAVVVIAREDWQLLLNVPDAITDLHTLILEFRFVVDRIQNASIKDKDFLQLRSSVFYFRRLDIQLSQIKDRIVEDKLDGQLPAILNQINLLKLTVLDLQKKKVWGP